MRALLPDQEARIQEMFNAVPEDIRDNIEKAAKWARKTLRDREGKGHQFYVTAAGGVSGEGLVCCSFSKPEWSGDHCSRGMEHGAEAIVMAVCEYLNGA